MNTAHKQKFYRHLLTYAAVILFLSIVNHLSSPNNWWVLWVAAGWGLGVVIQAINTFLPIKEKEDI